MGNGGDFLEISSNNDRNGSVAAKRNNDIGIYFFNQMISFFDGGDNLRKKKKGF